RRHTRFSRDWSSDVCSSDLNLDRSIEFYQKVFGAKLLVKGRTTAYFDLNGIWLALNVEKDISRNEIHESYTHIAFSIDESEFDRSEERRVGKEYMSA